MEKELFISTLKTKAGVDNLSDRTIDEVATVLLPQFADDTKITDESWVVPVQMLKSMSGQLRHEVAMGITNGKTQWENEQKDSRAKAIEEAVAAAKAQWEKEHGNGGNDDSKDDTASLDAKVADAVAKALEGVTGENGSIGKLTKQFSDYIARAEQEKKNAIIGKIREGLKTYLLDERMADREPVVNLAIKEMEIKEDSDFDKLKVQVEKKYEKLYKDFYGDAGGSPYAGNAGSGGEHGDSGAQAWLKSRSGIAEQEAAAAEARKKLLK